MSARPTALTIRGSATPPPAAPGRIRAGGIERDVTFTPVSELDAAAQAAVDAAYHAKYDRYGPQIVGTVTGAHAAPVTLRLVPQDASYLEQRKELRCSTRH